MGKGKEKLKGDALVNKVALIVIEVICIALILGYVSDFKAGNASLTYFVVFEIAAIITAVVAALSYLKWPDKMKYLVIMCYTAVYLIANLGASTDVAFVMGFPIVVVFILYYDYALIKRVTTVFIGIVAVDCLYVVLVLKHLHSGQPINSSVLLMEFLGTTVFMISVRVITYISNKNNEEKIQTIQAVATKVNESIHGINDEITQLNQSSDAVKLAMEEITSGVSNTTEAVQNQLAQTQNIQERIHNVNEAAEKISGNVGTTLGAVAEGNRDVLDLVEKADYSVEISNRVAKDLDDLKDKFDDMESITKIIESIAFKTNIMALNANVEAARAGEAGRGFAVVAQEISGMSAQTKDATDNIADIISNATVSLEELVKSIKEMADVINYEKKQTEQTSEIFGTIKKSTEEVKENVNLFIEYVNGLDTANREIVQSVETISATTQEVNALTNEAMDMEHGNAAALDSIAKQVKELAED